LILVLSMLGSLVLLEDRLNGASHGQI